MPTLHDHMDRHSVVDARPGRYLSFPDICQAGNGDVLVVYREADQHVASSRRLLLARSIDGGRTWGDPEEFTPAGGHCPRLTQSETGAVLCIDDNPSTLYRSEDNGRIWSGLQANGLAHCIWDRPLELGAGALLTAGHLHRGTHPHPSIGQPPAEQMTYLSEDGGVTWKPLSVINHHPHLVLCEASLARFPDGRILALLRENSSVHEPMYLCESLDQGRTWSDPEPTPLIGHRPCLGLTRAGDLLVTYRNTAPDGGTAAWMGTEAELRATGYQPHCLARPTAPALENHGLRIEAAGPSDCALYCLRPLTDPAQARATLEATVRVNRAERNGCMIHFGVWWRVFPDRILPDIPGARALSLPAGQHNSLRFSYDRGALTLHINNRKRRAYRLEADSVRRRPILFGIPPGKENTGSHCWTQLSLHIQEPRYLRDYVWRWKPENGLPDAWATRHVLELKNGRGAWRGDYGYSGWIEISPGEFLSAYHHAQGDADGYRADYTAQVVCTRFFTRDFPVRSSA